MNNCHIMIGLKAEPEVRKLALLISVIQTPVRMTRPKPSFVPLHDAISHVRLRT